MQQSLSMLYNIFTTPFRTISICAVAILSPSTIQREYPISFYLSRFSFKETKNVSLTVQKLRTQLRKDKKIHTALVTALPLPLTTWTEQLGLKRVLFWATSDIGHPELYSKKYLSLSLGTLSTCKVWADRKDK